MELRSYREKLRLLIDRSRILHGWVTPRRVALVLFGLALSAWLVALVLNTSPVAGGADSSGYMNNARLLLEGRVEGVIRPIPELPESAIPLRDNWPLGFRVDTATETLEPTYPIGFPLVLAPFQAVFGGRTGTWIVLILIGLAGPILTYLLARESGLSVEWSAFSGIALATSALFQMQAYSPMSDGITLAMATAALLLLLRFDRSPWIGIGLGFTLALAVLTRPANILLFVPVGLFLLMKPRRLRQAWTIALGGFPGAVFQVWLNLKLYGQVLTTSYGDFSVYFKWEYVLPSLRFFAHHGLVQVTPMVLLGLLAVPLALRRNHARLLPLAALAICYILFYATYFHSTLHWWSLRFILPIFPAVIILGAHAWQHVLPRFGKASIWQHTVSWLPIVFILLAIEFGGRTSKTYLVHYIYRDDACYPDSAAWLAEHTSEDDVLICMQTSGCYFYYLPNPIVRWDLLNKERWKTRVAPVLTAERRVFAALYTYEKNDGVLQTHIPGPWVHRVDIGQVSIYEWDRGSTP